MPNPCPQGPLGITTVPQGRCTRISPFFVRRFLFSPLFPPRSPCCNALAFALCGSPKPSCPLFDPGRSPNACRLPPPPYGLDLACFGYLGQSAHPLFPRSSDLDFSVRPFAGLQFTGTVGRPLFHFVVWSCSFFGWV